MTRGIKGKSLYFKSHNTSEAIHLGDFTYAVQVKEISKAGAYSLTHNH